LREAAGRPNPLPSYCGAEGAPNRSRCRKETRHAHSSQSWGLREFAIREPDGHVLRFYGYL